MSFYLRLPRLAWENESSQYSEYIWDKIVVEFYLKDSIKFILTGPVH
jgi:hypothetical protein